MTLVILMTLILTLAAPAAAQQPIECHAAWGGVTECVSPLPSPGGSFAPGTPLNPWRGTRDWDGSISWKTTLPPSDLLAPGSPMNPIRCRPTWDGRVECSARF